LADKHDRTEAPTPKRRREARRKGQIPRSQELVTWAQLFVVTSMLSATIGTAGSALREVTAKVGHLIVRPDEEQALSLLTGGTFRVMLAVLPLSLAVAGVGVAGSLAQTGLLLSSHGLKPKFDRLNPFKGLKRLLSPQSGWEAAKVLARTSILTGVALPPVRHIADEVVLLGHPDLHTILALVAHDALQILRNTALAGMALAAVDYGLQRRRVMRSLRMTKQELKDEHRLTEGDPLVKAAIRSRQQQMSRNRMMSEVATATAVIVNPTHVAVAIRYQPGVSAPVVVAKGRGAVALRIREEAERHRVPIMRDIPLARALHASCDLGQEIPVELYEAVARVLAVVMALKAA
jgi:flagellar biosynthetic protein FlhB